MHKQEETESLNHDDYKYKEQELTSSDEFWKNFIHKAPLEPAFELSDQNSGGSSEKEAKAKVIESIDHELIKKGQDYFEKNFPLMVFSLVVTALFGFSIKSTTAVLLRNSRFLIEPKESIARNLRTLWRIFRWHRSDFSMDKAVEQLFVVRRIHRLALKNVGDDWLTVDNIESEHPEEAQIAEAIRRDLDFVDCSDLPSHLFTYNSCGIPMSQFNLVCTQASSYAFVKAFPKAFGFIDSNGTDGLAHLSAVVGRAMGIKDEYNLILHDDDEKEGELSRRYVKSIALGGFKVCDTTTIVIHKCILEGLSYWFPFWVSHKGMMHMCFSIFSPEYKGTNLKNLMSIWDFLWVFAMRTALYLMAHYKIFRYLAQSINKWYIDAAFYKYLGQDNAKVVSSI